MRNLTKKIGYGVGMIAAMSAAGAKAQPPPPDLNAMTQGAIVKSLPLIQSSAATFASKMKCISCHNHSLPQMTVGLARERGFTADVKQANTVDASVYGLFAHAKDLMQAATVSKEADKQLDFMLVDPAPSMGYVMAGMEGSRQKPDAVTGLMAQYIARKQGENGAWPVLTARPPMEASEFASTALAVRALKRYGTDNIDTQTRIAKARKWLLSATPRTTEDKVFRLFGLSWAEAEYADVMKAREDLLSEQKDDGGWAQLPNMPSDPYATGEALVALHEAGQMAATEGAYQRGRFFLLTTQAADGSWFVPKRAVTVQTYVEAGYPHQNAQFISLAGACWATMALMYAVDAPPTVKPTARTPVGAAKKATGSR